ncbi:MAG: HemK2/MTQ2 family protein methyltransferase [Candidatus Nitrosopolaris sp.]|jgi:release factor glutamine methyltransferase
MYLPSDDSILLSVSVSGYAGESALEIGAGSGIILKALHENFKIVVGTDIDIVSLRHCKDNLPKDIYLACCDAAAPFRYKFDLIVSNPPYLPIEDDEKKDSAIHGDSGGIETTLHFIQSAASVLAKNGKMLIVVSSFSDSTKIDELIARMKLKRRSISEKKLFFETLTTLEIGF